MRKWQKSLNLLEFTPEWKSQFVNSKNPADEELFLLLSLYLMLMLKTKLKITIKKID